jgi:transposase-like protein
MTSWRDVQEAGLGAARKLVRPAAVAVIGADESVLKVKGKQWVVGFVVEPDGGELLGLELLIRQDSHAFIQWLKQYAQGLGVKVIVSDDLATYKPVVEELGVEHQVCLAHVRKNVKRRLKEIEGWEPEKAKVAELLQELSRGGRSTPGTGKRGAERPETAGTGSGLGREVAESGVLSEGTWRAQDQ